MRTKGCPEQFMETAFEGRRDAFLPTSYFFQLWYIEKVIAIKQKSNLKCLVSKLIEMNEP